MILCVCLCGWRSRSPQAPVEFMVNREWFVQYLGRSPWLDLTCEPHSIAEQITLKGSSICFTTSLGVDYLTHWMLVDVKHWMPLLKSLRVRIFTAWLQLTESTFAMRKPRVSPRLRGCSECEELRHLAMQRMSWCWLTDASMTSYTQLGVSDDDDDDDGDDDDDDDDDCWELWPTLCSLSVKVVCEETLVTAILKYPKWEWRMARINCCHWASFKTCSVVAQFGRRYTR